ncbi:DNA-protecting protein DprA [Denitratisoma sp. DHT3]|uniref:DNA-processing protein DprA n=1 Tax=Denitratisoma sp. DHT3 TaxID=1981880 RepID=UPI0011983B7A|nr:DNA-processing protein DprA [Denitratisoma sp. DHT3]QDX82146.1 DNA-protecting protein DprA [Denitratisoma sp. DHT3]
MTRDEVRDWLRLAAVPGLGGASQRLLLKAFGLPETIFAASAAALGSVVGEALARRILDRGDAADDALAAGLAWLDEPGNRLLTLADPGYPRSLLDGDDPPPLLYVKGRVELLGRPSLAVVGSRNSTRQGEANAQAFAASLSQRGLTIVSGLALGIDAAAHRGGLDGAGSTIAVIGTGPDRIYPARNAELAREIAERGVIVSEFAVGTPALPANFPRRNRIIAGLARGCLVVEAAERSGSLITARLAAEAGREVFAIPGSIHSPQSKGCHKLIKQGAKLVESAQDVLEELRWETSLAESGGEALSPAPAPGRGVGSGGTGLPEASTESGQESLLPALGRDPCTLDVLVQRTGLTADTLLAMLLPLELEGRIEQLPGGLYQRLA